MPCPNVLPHNHRPSPDGDEFTSIYSSPGLAHWRTVHKEPSTGAYTGRWPISEACASPAYSTPLRRATSRSAATAPTVLHAGLPLSGHVGAEQASSCCGCSDACMAAWRRSQYRDYRVHERSSRSAPSRLHQFCTSRQQLPPSTCHAGGQLSRRPLRWLAEEQSPLLNRLLRASAIGPDHLLASGTKDQAVGPLSQARSGTRSTIAFLRLDFGQKRDCPQGIFK